MENTIWIVDPFTQVKSAEHMGFLKRRAKNEDLRPKTPWTKTKTHGLKRRPLGLKRRPNGLKRLMLTAEGNAHSRNLLRRFGNVVEFPLHYSVVIIKAITDLPFLQVSKVLGLRFWVFPLPEIVDISRP